jgi:ATP-binding cassette, subfamily F, member 3
MPSTLLDARRITRHHGARTVLDAVDLRVDAGSRIALIGPNGSGKSTLLEALVKGEIGRFGHGVEVAYFSQHDVELDERGSVLECAMGATGLQRTAAQALLGRFLFSGWDEHEKKVVSLSGGERRRLALALIVASGANFLVLDEPTNHLDLESREALEAALEAFPGTVLLVSHDRAVLDAVAERIVAIEDRKLRSYAGGWADYVRIRAGEDAPPAAAKESKPKAAKPPLRVSRPNELQQVETAIDERETELAELERRLADDWSDVDTLAAHKAARDDLQALLARWEQLFEAAQIHADQV